MQVTFDNGAVGTHSLARQTTWRYSTQPQNRISFMAMGDTVLPGTTGQVDSWGIGRFNNEYKAVFTQPWRSNSYCGLAFPTDGEYTATSGANSLKINLGVNQQGNKDPRDCAYGYKITWTLAGGQTGSKVQSY